MCDKEEGWPGITCNSNGRVEKIELVDYGLTGSLPGVITQLAELHVL